MKILLANSNTSPAVTATILAAAQRAASPGTEVIGRNAAFGARVVGTHTEAVISAHALVDMLAEHGQGMDAVVIGMSMDTGVWAAREMMAVPVLGMTEAAMLIACTVGTRFGLVGFGSRGLQGFHQLVDGYGFRPRLAGIAGIGATPQDMLADPEALYRPIVEGAERLVAENDADVVILVGAVMAGLPQKLQERVRVPLLEGISCSILLAETLAKLHITKPRAGGLQPIPAREVIGLGPALTARLQRGG